LEIISLGRKGESRGGSVRESGRENSLKGQDTKGGEKKWGAFR